MLRDMNPETFNALSNCVLCTVLLLAFAYAAYRTHQTDFGTKDNDNDNPKGR